MLPITVCAQQLPYYTQFSSNLFMLNPAVAGTKGAINANIDYRMQWVGYEGAPRTASVSLHSRLANGKMGVGAYLLQDKVGPSQQTNIGGVYAYHIHFPDCELSAGLAGNYTSYTLVGDRMTLHNTQDPAANQFVTATTSVADAHAGIYLYNDRFHIGFSALHLMKAQAKFYKGDGGKNGTIQYVTQYYSTLGYNYSVSQDCIYENTLFVNYIKGVPLMVDYTLRLHIKQKFITGFSIRLRDAIAIHAGVTLDDFQVCYAYDILINRFRNNSSGSHEIMIKYNFSRHDNDKNGPRTSKFARQKYNIF
jgi:type IX secretion system PorP/SprF family membrane protein